MGDAIVICNFAERFFLLYNTMQNIWPFFKGYTICRDSWPWPPMLYNRRGDSLSFFILSKKILKLLIQLSQRLKEEV
jgi:hypothetical protein